MVKKATTILYSFLGVHVLLWTMAPALIRYTLPLDAMEGVTWGHQFEWGYDKNPFMNGWLTALAIRIGGSSGWLTYLFSQLSVAVSFWAVWRLSKKMLSPLYALVAVMLLEGIQYYNFHAIDFNDNTLELGAWALTILFFYQAIHQKDYVNWIVTGLFAGISMMIKYYVIVLLLPMFCFLLLDKASRDNFKKIPFYVGVISFFLVVTPHIIWLFSHHFITVHYAFERISSQEQWWVHLFFPARFTWQMLDTFLPAGLLFSLLVFGKTRDEKHIPLISVKSSDKWFLLCMGLGPFLLTVLLSAIFGIKLRAGWGQPLMSLWGLLLLVFVRPDITPKQFYRFFTILLTILMIAVSGYCIALIRADKPSSANYPGKIIATTLTENWHQQFGIPINYVAGARWLAGNVSLYSEDHPAVYIDWNKEISSWIDEKKLKQQGAIFVWDLSENDNVPFKEIKKRFPRVSEPQLMLFTWLRNTRMAPVQIKIAYLPPEHALS